MVISVVIPAHNKSELLRKCVESVLACEYPSADCEVIIIDDASSDDTAEVMRDLQRSAPGRVVLAFHEENRNAAAARNTGVLRARADVQVLAFLDQDCSVPPDWLERIKTAFETRPEIGYLGGRVLCKCRNIWQEWALYMSHRVCDHEDYQTRVIGTNMAFRQTVFWNNFFDEEVAYGTDETEFVFRLAVQGMEHAYLQDLVVYHDHRDNLLELIRQRWAYGQGEARFYAKYGFSIYHPINTYMLKTNITFGVAIALLLLGRDWLALAAGLWWGRYLVKYARVRYQSFLEGEGLPPWKIAAFVAINWLLDNVVMLSKLRVGNPI